MGDNGNCPKLSRSLKGEVQGEGEAGHQRNEWLVKNSEAIYRCSPRYFF